MMAPPAFRKGALATTTTYLQRVLYMRPGPIHRRAAVRGVDTLRSTTAAANLEKSHYFFLQSACSLWFNSLGRLQRLYLV